jgi:hypothetical protein
MCVCVCVCVRVCVCVCVCVYTTSARASSAQILLSVLIACEDVKEVVLYAVIHLSIRRFPLHSS